MTTRNRRNPPRARRSGPRPPALCRDCAAPIVWLTRIPGGSPIPVDTSPDPDLGTVLRQAGTDPVTGARISTGRILTGPEVLEARASGELLWMLHPAVCPGPRNRPRPAHLPEEPK